MKFLDPLSPALVIIEQIISKNVKILAFLIAIIIAILLHNYDLNVKKFQNMKKIV